MTVVFGSPKRIAWLIGIPIEQLRTVVADVERFYDPFVKKEPGKKLRLIDNPVGQLKEIQRRLNKRILAGQSLPAVMIGGVRGKDPLDHPRLHVGRKVVVTIDVKNCYPSITNMQVFKIWRYRIGCSPDVASLLTRLTTRLGHLPLGAPTSTPLGNLVLESIVLAVKLLVEQHELRLSQFIDDSALSGASLSDAIIIDVVRVFSRHGLRVNRKKIKVMRSGSSQTVTGRTVNRTLTLPSKRRKKVKAALHELMTTPTQSSDYTKRYRSVEGRIRDLKKLHPEQGGALLKSLQALPAV